MTLLERMAKAAYERRLHDYNPGHAMLFAYTWAAMSRESREVEMTAMRSALQVAGKTASKEQSMSLEQEDAAVAKISTAPRVTLADIEASIAGRYDVNGYDAVDGAHGHVAAANGASELEHPLQCLTLCILVLKNGYTVVGTSACVSPANYDEVMGQKIAYDSAIRQLWPLMGFALKDRMQQNTEFDGR